MNGTIHRRKTVTQIITVSQNNEEHRIHNREIHKMQFLPQKEHTPLPSRTIQAMYESRSRNHCCLGKAIRVTHYRCVFVAYIIQDAKRMHRIVLSSVASPAVHCFHTVSHEELGKYDQKCILVFT
jgi:hypothetical protein